MTYKNHILNILFSLCFCTLYSQEAILCPLQKDNIKIESTSDIPTVTNNNDGTVTLGHQDQNITDIFAQHIIYDFYQSYPNANPNGELIKYYTIVHGNKDLMTSISDNISSTIFLVEDYTFTSIDPNVIALLDNKTYKLKSYCSDVPEVGETCQDNQVIVSNDFDLNIMFSYDSNADIIRAETTNSTPCGNSFSIGLRGGFEDFSGSLENKVQLWESDLGISTESDFNQPCYYPEEMLYGLLDIGCFEGRNVGNLLIYESSNSDQIILERENATFSTDFMTLEVDNLSVNDNTFDKIKLVKTPNNPFLRVLNSQNQRLIVEILSTSGQIIFREKEFETNSIHLSNYETGLYFIKLSNVNNQHKTFKLLLN